MGEERTRFEINEKRQSQDTLKINFFEKIVFQQRGRKREQWSTCMIEQLELTEAQCESVEEEKGRRQTTMWRE